MKCRQVRSRASCAGGEGKRKVLRGNQKSAPGNTCTRRQEELTNFIAVLLEDAAPDPSLQSAAISMKVRSSHSLLKDQVIISILLGRTEIDI